MYVASLAEIVTQRRASELNRNLSDAPGSNRARRHRLITLHRPVSPNPRGAAVHAFLAAELQPPGWVCHVLYESWRACFRQ